MSFTITNFDGVSEGLQHFVFEVFDKIVDLKIFYNLPKVEAWRHVLQQRSSIQQAVIAEYPELLVQFLAERNSYISHLVTVDAAWLID